MLIVDLKEIKRHESNLEWRNRIWFGQYSH